MILWQDYILTTMSFGCNLALLPMFWHSHKPPLKTSIWLAALLCTKGMLWLTLGLWLYSGMSIVAGMMWVVVAVQKYQILRRHRLDRRNSTTA